MALTKIGAGLFKDTLKTNVSGALGDNATLIRSLTAAGVSGSFSQTHLSSKISGIVSGAAQIADNISGSFSQTHLSSKISGIVSASVLSSPAQGTIRLATNGVNNDVDSGLQAGDSPTFAGGTVTGNLTVGGTLTAQEIHTEFTSASIMFSSGSTKFGDTIDDTHEVTGSMTMSGSVTVNDGNLVVLDSLGIGTNSPTFAKLDINAPTATNADNLDQSVDRATLRVRYRTDETDDGMFFGGLGSNHGYIQGVADASNDNTSQAGKNIVINPYGGNVGVGTQTMDGFFSVNSGAQNAALHVESTDSSANISLADNVGSAAVINIGGRLVFETGGTASTAASSGTESMTISGSLGSAGNVGIGTATPPNPLTVFRSDSGTVAQFGPANTSDDASIYLRSNGVFNFFTPGGGDIRFSSGGSEALTLDSSQNATFVGDLTIPEKIIFNDNKTKPLLKKVASKHLPNEIVNRKKQGFRAPVGEWIKKDEKYFYEAIKEFNSSTNLFDKEYLNKIILGDDFQKKWYLANLAKWHLSRSSN